MNIGVDHRNLSLSTSGTNSFKLEVNRETVFQSDRKKAIVLATITKPRKHRTTILLGNLYSLTGSNQLRVVIREVSGGRSVKIYDGWKRVGSLRIGPESAEFLM